MSNDDAASGERPHVDARPLDVNIASNPGSERALGRLVVSRVNPRYFTPVSEERRAVYLTGSHIWNNLHDGMGPGKEGPEEPQQLDYNAYLNFLEEHGHNFIRLWRWEHFRSQAAGGDFHLCMTPQPLGAHRAGRRPRPGKWCIGRPPLDPSLSILCGDCCG